MRICLLVASWFALALSPSVRADAEHGEHCAIKEVPAQAADAKLLDEPVRVFPHGSKVVAGFNGCQLVFKKVDKDWLLDMKVVFKAGRPVLLLGAEGPIEMPDCRDAKTAKEREDECAFAQAFPVK